MEKTGRENGQTASEGGENDMRPPLQMSFKHGVAASSVILTYILWAFILIMIKNQGRHNCASAFPDNAFPPLLLTLLLTVIVFFLTLKKRKRPFLSAAVLVVYTFVFLAFFLTISIVAMCVCSDPAAITKTYLATTMMFAGDIAIEGAMFNGLV